MWRVGEELGNYLTYVLKDELLYYNFNWLCIPPYQIIDGGSYMITTTYLLLAI